MKRFLSPRRGHFWGPFLLAVLIALAGPHLAEAAPRDVSMRADAEAAIRLTSINENWDGHGWQAVRVRIENRSERAGTWDFEFRAWSGYRRAIAVVTPARIQVPARSTSETVVYVSGPGRSSERHAGMASWIANVKGPGVANDGYTVHAGSRQLDFTQIATSERTEEAVRRRTARHGGLYHGGGYELDVISPKDWPADWRVWSSFSAIAISREEHDELDGARRNALREWAAQGGSLWLVPASGRETLDVVGEPVTQVGLGRIYSELDTLLGNVAEASGRHVMPWGGVTELVTKDDLADWALERPVVALIIFLVVFGVVVGPINIFVFAPASRRQRLFVTVPLISLVATLLLGAVILVKDGFGGAGVRRSLVVLLPGENKAAVFQQQVSRTGVLLGSKFPLPADTLITIGSGESGRGTEREFARAGDTASGAWFSSRTMQVHDLRRITPTRARVELVDGGAGGRAPVVQSSVTTALTDFRYVDADGNRWTADELPPGKRVTLTATTTVDRGDVRGYFRAFGGATDLAPLATHASITWEEGTIIYTGRVESARQP